jgi:hypothetical protein
MYKKQAKNHEELGASIPPEKVSEWETLPTEAVKGSDGKWTRPLMDPVADGMSFLLASFVLYVQQIFTCNRA